MQTKIDGITLHVDIDDMPPHPRKDCDNLGTILGWHRNYNFSDKGDYPTSKDFWASDEAKEIYVKLPVYLLDHSGLYLSTSDFHDEWDSGLLGLIYCTKEQVEKWFGYLPDEQVIKDELRGEIEAYNNYLNGSWYEFYIEGLNGEIEDSCGGFYLDKGFSDLLGNMKEYVEPQYYPLFDKLVKQVENKTYMGVNY